MRIFGFTRRNTSASSKKVLLIDLTVSCEERLEGANAQKRSKYQELVDMAEERLEGALHTHQSRV